MRWPRCRNCARARRPRSRSPCRSKCWSRCRRCRLRHCCPPSERKRSMKIGLIIIGDEILSGKRQDKHLSKFIELLAARGLSLSWAQHLGDEREQIAERLREAFYSGDLVLCCGGIGATPDDHTRQAAALALGRPPAR